MGHQSDEGTVEVNGRARHGLTVCEARRLGIAWVPQRRERDAGRPADLPTCRPADPPTRRPADPPTRAGAVRWKAVNSEAHKALETIGIGIDVTRTAGSLTVAEQTVAEVARHQVDLLTRRRLTRLPTFLFCWSPRTTRARHPSTARSRTAAWQRARPRTVPSRLPGRVAGMS
jgi:hypothetical protein